MARNSSLYDLSGQLLATLTNHTFEVAGIVRVDEAANRFYYRARSGDHPMKLNSTVPPSTAPVTCASPILHFITL